MDVEVFEEASCLLGEGPIWDERTGEVLWLDILRRTVHRKHLDGPSTSVVLDRTVSALAPRQMGGFVCATAEGAALLDLSGDSPVLEQLGTYAEADGEPGEAAVRGNDAAVDPAGRFWLGTMAWDATDGAGGLYLMHPGAQELDRILAGVTISNGLGWSPDGASMFYIDSATQRVDVFDFDVATSQITERRGFVEVPASTGAPDGMAVDADGGIWVALFGGAAVHHYGPDGVLDQVVTMPCQQPTSCAFVGPDLDMLVITSAATGLDDPAPADGGTFLIDPGVRGLPTTRFAG